MFDHHAFLQPASRQGLAPTRRLVAVFALALALMFQAASARADTPYTPDSVARGRALFANNCTQCHGSNGKAQVNVVSNATDLTEPFLYRNGNTDKDIETSIRDGRRGVMPAFGKVFNNEESIGDLLNFIKSLWPVDKQPK